MVHRILGLLVCLGLAALLSFDAAGSPDTADLAVGGPASVFLRKPAAVEDPFPIVRLRASQAQLGTIFKQPETGPLVELPREEFESLVARGGRAVAAARSRIRITELRLKAELIGGDLAGSAELDVINTTDQPQLLSLEQLRLSITSATWKDGPEAILGSTTGVTGTVVWVEQPGPRTLQFRWSLAGSSEFGEKRFELRTPSTPSAVLDLDLPAGEVATAPPDVLVSGPVPANDSRTSWRFRFGGHTRLDFSVRPRTNPGVVSAASLVSRYDASQGQLTCTFEYDLRPARGTIGEWTFAVDAGLRVTDVVVNNRSGWSVDPPSAAGQTRKLHVRLHQPGAGGKVRISALAPFADTSHTEELPLPVIRPLNAVLDAERDELMEIRFSPDLKPLRWSPGDYRLMESQVQADQSRTISLVGTLLPAGSDHAFRRPPAIATTVIEPVFSATEQIAWRFDPVHLSARVKVGIIVRRGPLFRFQLQTPAGYGFVRAACNNPDVVASTAVVNGGVAIDFTRPLTTDQKVELTFDFQGPKARTARFPFPAFLPLGASETSGVIGLERSASWSVDAHAGAGTIPTDWLDLDEPAIPPQAAVSFRFRGVEPVGSIRLHPLRPDFQAHVTERTEPVAGQLQDTTLFDLRVARGALGSIIITESGPPAEGRTWRLTTSGNAIVSAVSVPESTFLNTLARFEAGGQGRVLDTLARGFPPLSPNGRRLWFIRLASEATTEVTLETTATRGAGPTRWAVIGSTESHSSHENGPESTPALSGQWDFADVTVVTSVATQSNVEAVFGGKLVAGGEAILPLRLPAGAEVLSASVEDRRLERGVLQLSADGTLAIPLTSQRPLRFEVRYRLPVDPGFITTVRSPAPVLPGEGCSIGRWWLLGSSIRPIAEAGRVAETDISSLPKLSGDAFATAPGMLVSRSEGEEVRVVPSHAADVIGIAITVIVFCLAWLGALRYSSFPGLLLTTAILALGLANLLASPWLQRMTLYPMLIGLVAMGMMIARRGNRALAAAAGLVALCPTIQPTSTSAQPTQPATVVIMPADPDGRETVIVPRALLDRLVSIARPPMPGPILTKADYQITMEQNTARVTARLGVHSQGGPDSFFTFPLGDVKAERPTSEVRLERITLDGKEAFPSMTRPGQVRVALPGKGKAEIEIHFVVSIGGVGPEREVRFAVPETPTTHILADLPATARQAQVVGRVGKLRLSDGNPKRAEADLGYVKSIHIRWREGSGGAASLKVREGSVWDISEAGARLTAGYRIRIDQGTIVSLRLDLPAELEPVGVTLRSLDSGAAGLSDWSLGAEQGGFRPLRLELQGPTSGQLLVVLTCVPRKATTRQPLLRFPKLIQGNNPGEPEAAYGLRIKGLTLEALARAGMIDFSPDALTRDFGDILDRRFDASIPLRVFRATPRISPELRPTLHTATDPLSVSFDTFWHVGPHQSVASGSLQWVGKENHSFLEFAVPGARMVEIRGADVASWSQVGGRIQVWLRKPGREGSLDWIGAITATPPLPSGAIAFEPPSPRVTDAHSAAEVLRFQPAEGGSLRIDRDRGWIGVKSLAEGRVFQSMVPTPPPLRVLYLPGKLDASEVVPPAPGQPVKPTQSVSEPPAPGQPPVTVAPRPDASSHRETSHVSLWPVFGAMGWCIAMGVLSFLMVCLPRSTWPEQFALVAALLSLTLLSHWWPALAAWLIARIFWFARKNAIAAAA
jgi:hypothetical protein